MSRHQRIHNALSQALTPDLLTVENESHRHSVPKGSESHFKILIVSHQFQNLNRIARHRKVHHLLQNELQTGLHALTLHLYTPQEWFMQKSIQDSPKCHGGKLNDL